MSNTLSPSRFILQGDWNVSIANKIDTFWAGSKRPGKDGVYCNFFPAESTPEGNDGDVKIQGSDPNFVGFYNPKKNSLRVQDPKNGMGTTFYAPSSVGSGLHQKNIYCLDVTAGGLGVSSDSVGNMIVWETKSFALRRSLSGHYADVYSCKFFPSGLVVLSGGADMQLKIWSVETGDCARTLIGHRQAITDLGFVDRGRNILSCSKDGTCRLWDCGSAACLTTFKPDCGQINALSLISGAKSAGTTPDQLEVGTENKLLALACENGSVVGYGLGDKAKAFSIKCDACVNAVTFLDQNTLVSGSDIGSISVLDIRKPNSFLHTINDGRGSVWSICPVGKGYWTSFGDGTVCYRTIDSARNGSVSEAELSGPDCDPVYRVCSDGRFLYTCCRDAKIRKYLMQ